MQSKITDRVLKLMAVFKIHDKVNKSAVDR